jgi:hypothetical protein
MRTCLVCGDNDPQEYAMVRLDAEKVLAYVLLCFDCSIELLGPPQHEEEVSEEEFDAEE